MNLEWHNEKRKVNDLIPYDRNPRLLTEKQAEDLRRSLEKFGLVEIPAIDTDNRIIAGHQRMKIMQLLERGNEEIDVRVPNRKLTDEEFDEYLIRSNRNVGSWDYDSLANNFEMNDLVDWGFDRDMLLDHTDPKDEMPDDIIEQRKDKGFRILVSFTSNEDMENSIKEIEEVAKRHNATLSVGGGSL